MKKDGTTEYKKGPPLGEETPFYFLSEDVILRVSHKWMKCKASKTEGEGSVLKYMTEPESRRQRSNSPFMRQPDYMISGVPSVGAATPSPPLSVMFTMRSTT